jgi:hypothetical protein
VEDVLKWQRTERHDESTTTTTDGASTVAAAARALEAAVASAADGDDGTAAAVPMPRASTAPVRALSLSHARSLLRSASICRSSHQHLCVCVCVCVWMTECECGYVGHPHAPPHAYLWWD